MTTMTNTPMTMPEFNQAIVDGFFAYAADRGLAPYTCTSFELHNILTDGEFLDDFCPMSVPEEWDDTALDAQIEMITATNPKGQ